MKLLSKKLYTFLQTLQEMFSSLCALVELREQPHSLVARCGSVRQLVGALKSVVLNALSGACRPSCLGEYLKIGGPVERIFDCHNGAKLEGLLAMYREQKTKLNGAHGNAFYQHLSLHRNRLIFEVLSNSNRFLFFLLSPKNDQGQIGGEVPCGFLWSEAV